MGYKYRLLVEGWDDQYVVRNLLKHHRIACTIPRRDPIEEGSIIIEGKEGVNSLLNALSIVLDDGDLEQLGIVVDANTDIEARWQAVRNTLLQAGSANIPLEPDPNGTIVVIEQMLREVTVGIWLMPNNKLPGILEDFISFLVPDGDPLWERARRCVAEIPSEERRFPVKRQGKAELHTWLAWQQEPGKQLGLAIMYGYLDAEAPHARQFVDWVRQLFDLA